MIIRAQDDESLRSGLRNAQKESVVLLLVDEGVVLLLRPHDMPEDLLLTMLLVDYRVHNLPPQ